MLFFRRQAHLCTISVRFHKENDFFKLFRLIVCFVLIKSYKNYQKKRMGNASAKRCAPSKIMLTSRLGNKVFQLFTEIINLASKLKCVRVKYGALPKKKGHRWLNFARRAVFHIAEQKKKCMRRRGWGLFCRDERIGRALVLTKCYKLKFGRQVEYFRE